MEERCAGRADRLERYDGARHRLRPALRERGRPPALAVILVGDDPASQVYVGMKEKMTEAVGMHSVAHRLPETTTEQELLAVVAATVAEQQGNPLLAALGADAQTSATQGASTAQAQASATQQAATQISATQGAQALNPEAAA